MQIGEYFFYNKCKVNKFILFFKKSAEFNFNLYSLVFSGLRYIVTLLINHSINILRCIQLCI